jgi:hypothetical protein
MSVPTVYATSARFDSAHPLSDDELMKCAPSIFANTAHESRSMRFQPIPTIAILNALRGEGFFPVAAQQSTSRDENKRAYTKHVVRLRRFGNTELYKVGDSIFEMLLKNANDGTSLYELFAGIFKIACMNSLVIRTHTIDTIKIRHLGKENIAHQVIEGTYKVLETSEKVLDAPRSWSQIQLQPEEKLLLAKAAHTVRFSEVDEISSPIKPHQLLIHNRREDEGNDLWTTFNVIQEHCLKGGDQGYRQTGSSRTGVRRITTRPIKNIDHNLRLNQALWMIAESFATNKQKIAA